MRRPTQLTPLSLCALFLCMCLCVQPGTANIADVNPCGEEWLYSKISGKCYHYFETLKTWSEANIECKSGSLVGSYPGGKTSLAKVESELDLAALNSVFNKKGNFEDQWIGGKNVGNGTYFWADNTPVDEPTGSDTDIWKTSNTGSGDCVAYVHDNSMDNRLWRANGFIHKSDCSKRHGYFCEYEAKNCAAMINVNAITNFNPATMELAVPKITVNTLTKIKCKYGYFRESEVAPNQATPATLAPGAVPANHIHCSGQADADKKPEEFRPSLLPFGATVEECILVRCPKIKVALQNVRDATYFMDQPDDNGSGGKVYYDVGTKFKVNCTRGFVDINDINSTIGEIECKQDPFNPSYGNWFPYDYKPCIPVQCSFSEMIKMKPKTAEFKDARNIDTQKSFSEHQITQFNKFHNEIHIKCLNGKFFDDRAYLKKATCMLKKDSDIVGEWMGTSGTKLNETKQIDVPCVPVYCEVSEVDLRDADNGGARKALNYKPIFTVTYKGSVENKTEHNATNFPFSSSIRYFCADNTASTVNTDTVEVQCDATGHWSPKMTPCLELGQNTSGLTGNGKFYIPEAQEAPGAETVGSIVYILLAIFFSFILILDLSTISRDYKLLKKNLKNIKKYMNKKNKDG